MDSERQVSFKQGYLVDLPKGKNGNGLAVFSSDPKNLTEEESEAL